MRTVAAVLAGYLVFASSAALLFGVSGRDPHVWPDTAFLIGALVFVALSSATAGFVSARVARAHAPQRPASILAAILGVIAAASMAAQWRAGSVWSELAVIFVSVPYLPSTLNAYSRLLPLPSMPDRAYPEPQ